MKFKYPLSKPKRLALIRLYFEMAVQFEMPEKTVETCADTLATLLRPKKKLDIKDIRLPWRPLYEIIKRTMDHPEIDRYGNRITNT